MVIVTVKGHEIDVPVIKDSFNRRALKYKNNIITTLRQIGLTEDDVEIELERVAIKKLPASVSWYFDYHHLHYSYMACSKYVENLYVVSKVIELEVAAVISGKKSERDFIADFMEEDDVKEERETARKYFGLDADHVDLASITKKYKELAKKLHPDVEGGDVEKFKELNRAHKILKRELE